MDLVWVLHLIVHQPWSHHRSSLDPNLGHQNVNFKHIDCQLFLWVKWVYLGSANNCSLWFAVMVSHVQNLHTQERRTLMGGGINSLASVGNGFDPWSRKIPPSVRQLSPCSRTAGSHTLWSLCSRSVEAVPVRSPGTTTKSSPLAATRESLWQQGDQPNQNKKRATVNKESIGGIESLKSSDFSFIFFLGGGKAHALQHVGL